VLTLWDLIPSRIHPRKRRRADSPPLTNQTRLHSPAPTLPASPPGSPLSMAQRYELVTRTMLQEHGVRVRKWRTSMSGIAWQVRYRDGSVARLIEAPRPKGPMSAAIFFHEIGHHAIGFHVHTPRCLEEYHAWAFALDQMERHGLNVTDAVRRRMHDSLHYALAKALRRGLRRIPPELRPFAEPPRARPTRGRSSTAERRHPKEPE